MQFGCKNKQQTNQRTNPKKEEANKQTKANQRKETGITKTCCSSIRPIFWSSRACAGGSGHASGASTPGTRSSGSGSIVSPIAAQSPKRSSLATAAANKPTTSTGFGGIDFAGGAEGSFGFGVTSGVEATEWESEGAAFAELVLVVDFGTATEPDGVLLRSCVGGGFEMADALLPGAQALEIAALSCALSA